VSDGVAIYAAVVGTGSLSWQIVWQVHRARRADQPQIDVHIRTAVIGIPGGSVSTVVVEAVNRGDRSVGIRGAGLELQDGSGETFVSAQSRFVDSIPGTVEPHDSLKRQFEVETLEQNGFDLRQPLVGFVNLVSGVARSEPTTLRP
jgi:hypothetical protein